MCVIIYKIEFIYEFYVKYDIFILDGIMIV